MAELGVLTKSGLLWEGNLADWNDRVHSVMLLHNLERFDPKLLQAGAKVMSLPTDATRAAYIMRNLISPGLLDRIPREMQTEPHDLCKFLSSCCVPFPFLGLPPELRNRIYDHVFEVCNPPITNKLGLSAMMTSPITRVSKQLRAETLVMAILQTHFHLCIDNDTFKDETRFKQSIQSFADAIGHENFQHLRKLTLTVKGPFRGTAEKSEHMTFLLQYSPDAGFTMTRLPLFRGFLAPEAVETLVASVESSRKLLKLQGQAILLALSTGVWTDASHLYYL